MSPYEVPPQSIAGTRQTALQALLPRFDVTGNGFLPDRVPLSRLPDPYYAPWESLIQSLASHIQDNTVRDHINKLPVLALDRLHTEDERRRAYLILTFFAHGYIWGGAEPADVLPPPVTVPLLQISDILGLPPTATFASFNLWNFTSSHPSADFTDVDSLDALHTFTGTQDESWFYMVSVAIEAQGAYIIPILLQGLDTLQSLLSTTPSGDESSPDDFIPEPQPPKDPTWKAHQAAILCATKSLVEISTCIAKMGHILDKMHAKCDPHTFYHRIRPFLAGSKNMAAAGLPLGVFYDEGPSAEGQTRKGQYRQLRGGSNGQSSLIQFLDIILGVEHSSSGNSQPESDMTELKGPSEKTTSFHQEVRSYMPRRHREFLEYVMEHGGGGFRGVISQVLLHGPNMTSDGDETAGLADLIRAFKTATKALAEFRNKHLQLVTRYIIIPSRQQSQVAVVAGHNGQAMAGYGGAGAKGIVNLATASTSLMANGDKNQKDRIRHAGEAEGEVGDVTTVDCEESHNTARTRKGSSHQNPELTGTGGTALLPFLKQSRDETLLAGDLMTVTD
ncbi:putative indoleamine 2,3-dioxygenase [Rhypophila decipiens]|uniref:Indoleamine 2,3-dioxygenase n=1 Tax=Rhypophila decipiens TaxID=261697 RepID=A0AAN6XUK5_9PEZI|nr:putative indoleamine 2,3-dioxygenase [Rhypophila decipiens]